MGNVFLLRRPVACGGPGLVRLSLTRRLHSLAIPPRSLPRQIDMARFNKFKPVSSASSPAAEQTPSANRSAGEACSSHPPASTPVPKAVPNAPEISKHPKLALSTVSAPTAPASSNWAALKAVLAVGKQPRNVRGGGATSAAGGAERPGGGAGDQSAAKPAEQSVKPASQKHAKRSAKSSRGAPTTSAASASASHPNVPSVAIPSLSACPLVALDCEMVGVGAGGRVTAAARVCMVDASGSILLDTFVRPLEPVTDLRTAVSGVREEHLSQAPALAQVRPVVASLLQNRLLVGHALRNDLEALGLSHPRKRTRDTTAYPPFLDGAKGRARPLKALAQEELGLEIQTGEHSPVEDARAALYLYLKHRRSWEAWVKGRALPGGVAAPQKLLSWEELAKKDAMADL